MPEHAPVKELHVAKSVAELKRMALNKDACTIEKLNKCESGFLKSITKCYNMYKEYCEQQDEEKMYIYLFKYLEMYSFVQKNSSDRAYVEKYVGGKNPTRAIKELAILDKRLRQRYEIYNAKQKASTINGNGLDCSAKETALQMIIDRNEDTKDVKKVEYTNDFIKCKQLFDLISSVNSNILIMDVRSPEAFQTRIMSNCVINIPSSIIKSGISAMQLEGKLPDESKALWQKRASFEHVVLVDFDTNKEKLGPNLPIYIMREILNKWDYPTIYKHKPLILKDGIKEWVETYPTKTINPSLLNLSIFVSKFHTPTLPEEIMYPDSDEEKEKEKQQEAIKMVVEPDPQIPTTSRPIIDRSVKPNLEKKNSLDRSTRDIFNSIPDVQMSVVDENKPPENNYQFDANAKIDITASSEVPKYTKEKENHNNIVNGETESVRHNWNKNNLDINYTNLKFDSSKSSGSPGLKKSLSSPNIAKGDDNMEVLLPKTPPTLDRSKKPAYLTSNDSPRYGMQDKQYRIISQGELDGAVIGANISRGLTGLKNLGNSCYMNSILQCISNTTELREELCKFYPGESFRNTTKSKTEGIIAREVERVIRTLWHGNIKYFSCSDLKSVIGRFRSAFKGYEQQDSHEFFTILMDWLHEDLNEPSPKGDLLGAAEETGEKAWGEFRKDNNSIVLNLFYGQQKSTVRCDTCGKQSVTFEPFSNLSLLLPSNKDTCTLFECLDLYLKHESISGWNCPDCKVPRNATKKVDITRLPPVLVIHFKRFTSNGWCRKKQTFINFPIEGLNMRNFAVDGSEQRNEVYNLFAVSNHYGTMESGHYTAYCYNTEINRWYKFDDQEVSDISPNDVKTSAAYILFYSAIKTL